VTLALAIRAADGLVLASDSRVTSPRGETRDTSEKFLQVSRDVGVMTYGIAAPGYAGITRLVNETKINQYSTFDQIIESASKVFKSEFEEWLNKTQEIPEDVKPRVRQGSGSLGFVIAGYDDVKTKQFRIVSYEAPTFQIQEIVASPIFAAAQWHIAQYLVEVTYYPEISVKQLCNLAVFVFLETTTVETTVGGPIQLAIVTKSQGYQRLHDDDIQRIIENVQGQICSFRTELLGVAKAICMA